MCGKTVKKPSWLSNARYAERKYCSRTCYAKWMSTNQKGWWERKLDFRNRNITPDDLRAIDALVEFKYLKREEILLPGDTEQTS